MKKSESQNLVIFSEVKWSEMFSLKIHLKVKKSEISNIVIFSEVKWSDKISPNFTK